MTNLATLQSDLAVRGWRGLLLPSGDEYLSEFAQPFARRLKWATGFTGSTGLAVVLTDRAALFLDGRYRAQGMREACGGIEVLGAEAATREDWWRAHLRPGDRLAIDTRLHAHAELEPMLAVLAELGVVPVERADNPVDALWADRPPAPASTIFDYPLACAGRSTQDKSAALARDLRDAGLDGLLLADPEDVAWLLNARTRDSETPEADGWHVVPIALSRAFLDARGDAAGDGAGVAGGHVTWFVAAERLEPPLAARLAGQVTLAPPAALEGFLAQRGRGATIGANLATTPWRFTAILAEAGTLRHAPAAAHARWTKHPAEIARAREGHFHDGRAVIRFLAWLSGAVPQRPVTEREAARQLAAFRAELEGYRGPSMPFMSASGISGALPHYVPSEASDRRLNDHPVYWMDSGGQYPGCSTDNTVCLAVGPPEPRHVRAHTLVVKGFIALTLARFPEGVASSRLDTIARLPLWGAGMDYDHATGHGVGNFMNIHEGPGIRAECGHHKVVPMREGMIVTNEPACYVEGDFGIRVESHMATVRASHAGFLEFETLSRLPIDPALIDPALLDRRERAWLATYHRRIAADYEGWLDADTMRWLQQVADRFAAMQEG